MADIDWVDKQAGRVYLTKDQMDQMYDNFIYNNIYVHAPYVPLQMSSFYPILIKDRTTGTITTNLIDYMTTAAPEQTTEEAFAEMKDIIFNDRPVKDQITSATTIKPSTYKISDLHWKFAVRAVLRGKNLMIVGLQGCGKTVLAYELEKALNRPLFNIPFGATQDARSSLIGNTHFKDGQGTFVKQSYFVEAIQTPNAIVLLDEITRAGPDAGNILMSVLDYKQRYLRIDESPETPTIKVADGVTFIATANIGHKFTGTRTLDSALADRFTILEVEPLDKESEKALLKERFPNVREDYMNGLLNIGNDVRQNYRSLEPNVSDIISTRMVLEIAELLEDGFTLLECAETTIYPFFSAAGGDDGSERSFVKKLVQNYAPKDQKTPDVKSPFSDIKPPTSGGVKLPFSQKP